jgi:hypothetical protein
VRTSSTPPSEHCRQLGRPNPGIENSAAVRNRTDNRHGMSGYLDDKDIARRIYDTLTAA